MPHALFLSYLRFFSKLTNGFSILAGLLTIVALWVALHAPEDYQQGATIRIMFLHVPAAWMALMIYGLLSLFSVIILVWGHPLAMIASKPVAYLGLVFTMICLVTGSLWGRPMWGTWWVWDARLASVLVLFLLYLGIVMLWRIVDDPYLASRITSIITLVGSINIPVIKFSVYWWNTLHQPSSIFRREGPSIHEEILLPLLFMTVAYIAIFIALSSALIRNEVVRHYIRSVQIFVAQKKQR